MTIVDWAILGFGLTVAAAIVARTRDWHAATDHAVLLAVFMFSRYLLLVWFKHNHGNPVGVYVEAFGGMSANAALLACLIVGRSLALRQRHPSVLYSLGLLVAAVLCGVHIALGFVSVMEQYGAGPLLDEFPNLYDWDMALLPASLVVTACGILVAFAAGAVALWRTPRAS